MMDPANQSNSQSDLVESGGDTTHRLVEGTTNHAIFMLDADGNIITWSAPAKALYGYNTETALNQHIQTLFANKNSADSNPLPEEFFDKPKTDTVELEHWHRRADESIFWGTLTLSPLWENEFEGYAAISRDTTTAKEYKRMLERQNDRLKEFTDILVHDLRNPLSIIDGYLKQYQETGNEKHLETIDETTDRMERLVEDLLRVARQGNIITDPEPTDIGEVIETAWQNLTDMTNATLNSEPINSVSGDPDRLCELFENCFQNAVEHSEDSVTVRVGPLDTGFYIEDNGPGIPDEHRDQVFDHGFTTRDNGHGYGLSVVRTIVNAHGWDIIAVDAQSSGARFEITGIEFLD